jgi:uncharacterized protein YjbJ (UPF0337 family)
METAQKNTDRSTGQQDMFASRWQQMRGTLRSWWGKLTDDDWERIAGHKDRLIGMLQEKYGYAKDMAMREVERHFQEYSGQSKSNEGYSGMASNASQEVKNAYNDLSQSATNAYGDAKAKVQEMGAAAADRVGGATKAVGETISSLAGTIRDRAPQEGTMGSAVQTVANQLDSTASYLQETDMESMARDITGLIRRYPLYSLLVGFGLGYLFSRRSGR